MSTSLQWTLQFRRGDSLSLASCTLYLNKTFSLNFTSNQSTPHTCWPISIVKQGFFSPLGVENSRGEKEKNLCHMPKSTGCYWHFMPSAFLPSVLEATCWQLVWHVCHSHSFTLNCFGVWHFIPIKGWAAMPFWLCCCAILVDHRLTWL